MDNIDVITDLHPTRNGDVTANGRAHAKKPLRPPDQFPPPPPPDMSRDLWSSNNSLGARDSRGSADMRWDLVTRGEGKVGKHGRWFGKGEGEGASMWRRGAGRGRAAGCAIYWRSNANEDAMEK
ncbi:hypothetical protein PoB_002369800 [Plakobranchus ocellatus]|uniref:Uncharacterized protein n=1 Tax=Plakobranchus ocellatus TaxID=259542 RepID=A0AAV3ZRX1_9GAST|nr:hypothetical protein PoB_002369800 [Plakobranchus ocellatus]